MSNLKEQVESEITQEAGDTTSLFLPTLMPKGFPSHNGTALPRSGIRPQSSLTPGKDLTVYQREKRLGIRRTNGALKLKKLSTRHLEILARHMEGESGEQISKVMNLTGVTISRVLNDPLSKEFLNRIYADRQNEIDALAGAAIGVVRDGLTGEHTLREKLTAVDKYTKLKDSIGNQEESADTAEDVIERMFKSLTITDSNVQVNLGGRK